MTISSRFNRKIKRRGYLLHEHAEFIFESFSGLTLHNRHHNNRTRWTLAIRFLSDEFFPSDFTLGNSPAKGGDATFLKHVTGLNTCLVAHVYYSVPDESDLNADVPSDFLIYSMTDKTCIIADVKWVCAWRFDCIEDALRYSFHNLFDVHSALALDSDSYRLMLDKLRLGS